MIVLRFWGIFLKKGGGVCCIVFMVLSESIWYEMMCCLDFFRSIFVFFFWEFFWEIFVILYVYFKFVCVELFSKYCYSLYGFCFLYSVIGRLIRVWFFGFFFWGCVGRRGIWRRCWWVILLVGWWLFCVVWVDWYGDFFIFFYY